MFPAVAQVHSRRQAATPVETMSTRGELPQPVVVALLSEVVAILRREDEWLGPTAIADRLGLQGGWRGPAVLCVLEMLATAGRVESRVRPNGRRVWQVRQP